MIQILHDVLFGLGAALAMVGGVGILGFVAAWALNKWISVNKLRRILLDAYGAGYKDAIDKNRRKDGAQ